ncbi:MAG: 1-phosphofructokinase [Clostridiales bacterium]|nr:1-phosphofructokinase [Clostridiales bacterium]
MITTVTLNPAIDKTMTFDHFEPGEINRASAVREDMGGKGINVAKLLSHLDIPITAIGFIGSQNANYVHTLLKDSVFKKDFVAINALTRTNIKLVDLSKSETTDINDPGFMVSENDIQILFDKLALYAEQSDYLILSGSAPTGTPKTLYRDMIRQFNEYTRIVVDAEGELLVQALEASPFLIKPNLHELENALGKPLKTDAEIIEECKRLIERYRLTYILVSMGGDGSLLVSADEAWKALPIRVPVKSTVGAGDSMVAGFIYGLVSFDDPSKALAYGAACGALAVGKSGTEAFEKSESDAFLDRIQIVHL